MVVLWSINFLRGKLLSGRLLFGKPIISCRWFIDFSVFIVKMCKQATLLYTLIKHGYFTIEKHACHVELSFT